MAESDFQGLPSGDMPGGAPRAQDTELWRTILQGHK